MCNLDTDYIIKHGTHWLDRINTVCLLRITSDYNGM